MTTYYYINTTETTYINHVLTVDIYKLASIILDVNPNYLPKLFSLDNFKGDEDAAFNWLLSIDTSARSNARHLVAKTMEDLTARLSKIEAVKSAEFVKVLDHWAICAQRDNFWCSTFDPADSSTPEFLMLDILEAIERLDNSHKPSTQTIIGLRLFLARAKSIILYQGLKREQKKEQKKVKNGRKRCLNCDLLVRMDKCDSILSELHH